MTDEKMYTYHLVIYVPAEWKEKLKEEARRRGFRTVSEMMRYIIRKHVIKEE